MEKGIETSNSRGAGPVAEDERNRFPEKIVVTSAPTLSAQVRLLRVLEAKTYEPLGSSKTVKTNARVITATHRNLEKAVQEGQFREDLYYRINVIRLSIPPLSKRKEDIPLLVQ